MTFYIENEEVIAALLGNQEIKILKLALTDGPRAKLEQDQHNLEWPARNYFPRRLKNSTARSLFFAATRVLYGPPRFFPFFETTR